MGLSQETFLFRERFQELLYHFKNHFGGGGKKQLQGCKYSLIAKEIPSCNIIVGVTSYHLCHTLLVRSKSQVPSPPKGRGLSQVMNTRKWGSEGSTLESSLHGILDRPFK